MNLRFRRVVKRNDPDPIPFSDWPPGQRLEGVKLQRARGGCLGAKSRRRTWQAAKSSGESRADFDPEMSEWGNPAGVVPSHSRLNQIGREEVSQRTETSQ